MNVTDSICSIHYNCCISFCLNQPTFCKDFFNNLVLCEEAQKSRKLLLKFEWASQPGHYSGVILNWLNRPIQICLQFTPNSGLAKWAWPNFAKFLNFLISGNKSSFWVENRPPPPPLYTEVPSICLNIFQYNIPFALLLSLLCSQCLQTHKIISTLSLSSKHLCYTWTCLGTSSL